MKNSKWLYLMAGFVAGIMYLVACGGGGNNSLAASIGSAVEVLYDNTASFLTGTNTQEAIDELAAGKFPAHITPSTFEGTWTGKAHWNLGSFDFEVTFNADGTVDFTVPSEEEVSDVMPWFLEIFQYATIASSTYEVIGNSIVMMGFEITAPSVSVTQAGFICAMNSDGSIMLYGENSILILSRA